MKFHNTIFAMIKNTDGKFLFTRRAPGDSFGGMWDVPGGGMEAGEQPWEALEREVLEESGLKLEAGRLLSAVAHFNPEKDTWKTFLYYAMQHAGGLDDITLSEDHTDYCWKSLAEAEKELELGPALNEFIERAKHEKLYEQL